MLSFLLLTRTILFHLYSELLTETRKSQLCQSTTALRNSKHSNSTKKRCNNDLRLTVSSIPNSLQIWFSSHSVVRIWLPKNYLIFKKRWKHVQTYLWSSLWLINSLENSEDRKKGRNKQYLMLYLVVAGATPKKVTARPGSPGKKWPKGRKK